MNTGVQRSGRHAAGRAHRDHARPSAPEPGNAFGQGKSAPLIAMAHEIPYVATATVADLRDLEAKVERAMELRGARYLHVLVTCPLGWGTGRRRHRPDRAAGHRERPLPGLRGRARARSPRPRRSAARCPSRTTCARRGATPTSSSPSVRDGRHRAASRPARTAPSSASGSLERMTDKPFAITLDVGSSLRQPHRVVAHRAPRVRRTAPPPCGHACPAGEDVQGWLYHAEEGDYEAAWRKIMEDNPLPAVMGRVCYHPCETACNRGQLDEAVGHQLGRALPRRRGAAPGLDGASRRRRPPAAACSSSAPGPPGSRRPTT